jgi:hypothetical protein
LRAAAAAGAGAHTRRPVCPVVRRRARARATPVSPPRARAEAEKAPSLAAPRRPLETGAGEPRKPQTSSWAPARAPTPCAL